MGLSRTQSKSNCGNSSTRISKSELACFGVHRQRSCTLQAFSPKANVWNYVVSDTSTSERVKPGRGAWDDSPVRRYERATLWSSELKKNPSSPRRRYTSDSDPNAKFTNCCNCKSELQQCIRKVHPRKHGGTSKSDSDTEFTRNCTCTSEHDERNCCCVLLSVQKEDSQITRGLQSAVTHDLALK